MAKPRIIHMLFPTKNVSPFDVNMAADAGYEVIVPYTNISADDVTGLVQDAIFSRPPGMHNHTAAFVGGWDVNLAAQMLDQARKALVAPFEIALMADPNGAYTTAAASIAMIGKQLAARGADHLRGCNVKIFGGGPVGLCAAVLVAQQGGNPTLVRLTPLRAEKQAAISQFCTRYSVELESANGESEAAKTTALTDAHVVITTAKAGIQILTREQLSAAPNLQIAADINAVPPTGIEGVDPHDNGKPLELGDAAVGIGALAIGAIKYKVQNGLLKQMQTAEQTQIIDFQEAYELAVKLA